MEPVTPITPLESGVEMFTRGRPASIIPLEARLGQRLSIVPEVETPLLQSEFKLDVPRPLKPRPLSEVTEIFSDEDEPKAHLEHDQVEDDYSDEYEDDHSVRSEVENGDEYMHNSDEESEFEEDSDESECHFDEEAWRRSNSTISTLDDIQTPRSSRLVRGPALRLAIRQSCEGPRGPHLFRASTASSEFSEFERALQLSPIVPDYTRSPDQYYRQSQAFEAAFDKLDTPTTAITETAYTIPPLGWGWQREDPRSWTAQQVTIWMQESRMEPNIIQMFADNDIAGTVLMDLEFTDLKELGLSSFGKRHQVWNHICTLRNNHGHISPEPTPFEEGDDNRHSAHSKESQDSCNEPLNPVPKRKKKRNGFDPITPADSVSIVAIEQLIPRQHKCPRGENCQKWKKQQKLLRKLRVEHGLPISPEKGGHIFMAGNPGNAATASNVVNNVRREPHRLATEFRPTSDALMSTIGPSVVASSDLLGPGQQPLFSLDPDALDCVEQRDPQDNVQAFLALQKVEPPVYIPPPFDESIPEDPDHVPDMRPPENSQRPLASLQALPRLQIPSNGMVPFHHPENPSSAGPTLSAADDFFSPCMTAAATPLGASVYRFGTPASEMDVPVTQPPVGPVARDTSQSVPPSMQFRDPVQRSGSRAADWHRPSFQLAPVIEEGATQAIRPVHMRANSTRSANSAPSDTMGSPTTSGPSMTAPSSKTSLDVYDPRYPNVTHSGWMKKRKTKLLRHEWHEHHFRLNNGAQLTMHKNDMPMASALESLNIDEYSIGCSSVASTKKLNAKFKALKLQKAPKDKDGASAAAASADMVPKDAAFSFQLVPTRPDGEESGKLRNVVEGKKTHHFAVKTRDERIDWMRELMLAKALREKEANGYEVEINRSEKAPQSGRSSSEQQQRKMSS